MDPEGFAVEALAANHGFIKENISISELEKIILQEKGSSIEFDSISGVIDFIRNQPETQISNILLRKSIQDVWRKSGPTFWTIPEDVLVGFGPLMMRDGLPELIINMLDVKGILPLIKDDLSHDEREEVNHTSDQITKITDIIQNRCFLNGVNLFNNFMIALAGIEPECFKSLTGRQPSPDEAKETIKRPIHKLKTTIVEFKQHKPDNPWDKSIDLEKDYVKLRVNPLPSPSVTTHLDLDHPMAYQHSLAIGDSDIEVILEQNKSPGHFYLIRGRCGIGKSTMMQHLNHRWAENRCLSKFPVIFLIPIRSLSLASTLTLHGLLTKYNLYPNDVPAAWINHWQSRVLVILEGLDEFTDFAKKLRNSRDITDIAEEATQQEICFSLLKRKLLPKATLVCTSRFFEGLRMLKPDQQIEVMGLTKKGVHEFIQKNVAPEKQKHVESYLSKNVLMMSICSITFYASVLCRLLENEEKLPEDAVQTYTRLTSLLVMAYAHRKDSDRLEDIRFRESFKVLAEIAFHAQSGEGGLTQISFDLDHLEDIPMKSTNAIDAIEAAKAHGLVHITDRVVDDKRKQVLEFPHLCQQELFAALEFLRCSTEESETRFEELLQGGPLDMFQLFVYGSAFDNNPSNDLKLIKKNVFGSANLSEEKRKFLFDTFDKLLSTCLSNEILLKVSQIAYEAQDVDLAQKVVKKLESEYGQLLEIFNQSLNALDVKALTFICRKASFSELTFSKVQLDDVSLEIIWNMLDEKPAIKCLNLPSNDFRAEAANTIAKALERNLTLTSLNVACNEMCAKGGTYIAYALEKNTTLTEINLERNNLGPDGAISIANALENNSSLENINLSRNEIQDDGAIAIAKVLTKNTSVREINLAKNNMGCDGGVGIGNLLETNTFLTSIDLSDNNLGEEGSRIIASALATNKALESLDLDLCKMGTAGVINIANALHNNTSMKKLSLGENSASIAGARAIGHMLRTNKTLTELNFSWNKIKAEGAREISQALEYNNTLQELCLRRNDLRDEGAVAIANCLARNKGLANLDLQQNLIGDEGAMEIAQQLQMNNTIESISLGENMIRHPDELGQDAMLRIRLE